MENSLSTRNWLKTNAFPIEGHPKDTRFGQCVVIYQQYIDQSFGLIIDLLKKKADEKRLFATGGKAGNKPPWPMFRISLSFVIFKSF